MAASTSVTPGMNWIYHAPQIHIPAQLPHILKTYIKSAIRTQPHDLLAWSAYYFKCVHGGQTPPVKKHLEFPLFAGPGGLTPGYLAVLVQQLGREGFVPVSLLYEKWLGLTLSKDDLDRMMLLRHYPDHTMNIAEFIAIAAGHLCKTLSGTMILVCELLTVEPEGGSAKIPLATFSDLYTMLAELDCGPPRPDEIVVQNIILPFGAKDSKLWSIPEGVPPDIRDFIRKHFQSVQSDIFGEYEEEAEMDSFTNMSSCMDLSTLARLYNKEKGVQAVSRPPSTRMKRTLDEKYSEHASEDGIQVWRDPCSREPFALDGSCTASDSQLPGERKQEEAREPLASGEIRTMLDDVIENRVLNRDLLDEINTEAETNESGESESGSDMKDKDLIDISSVLSIPPAESADFIQEDENLFSSLDQVPSGLVGPHLLAPVESGDSVRTGEVKCKGELLLRYHVPGIGPSVPVWQIEQVLEFLQQRAQKQDGFVMPRNIRHAACPPLDLIDAPGPSEAGDCPEAKPRSPCDSASEVSSRPPLSSIISWSDTQSL